MLNIEKGSIRVNDYRKSECDVEVFILLLQHNSYSSNIIDYCWAIESSNRRRKKRVVEGKKNASNYPLGWKRIWLVAGW